MKELAYRVFVDAWRLAAKYGFQKLDEDQWERFIDDAGFLMKRYKGTESEILFRKLFLAVQSVYEKFEQEV